MAWKFKLIALLLTAMSFMPAVLGAITKRNAMNQDMRLGLEIYILQLTPINKYMTTTTELSAILRKEDLIFFAAKNFYDILADFGENDIELNANRQRQSRPLVFLLCSFCILIVFFLLCRDKSLRMIGIYIDRYVGKSSHLSGL